MLGSCNFPKKPALNALRSAPVSIRKSSRSGPPSAAGIATSTTGRVMPSSHVIHLPRIRIDAEPQLLSDVPHERADVLGVRARGPRPCLRRRVSQVRLLSRDRDELPPRLRKKV